MKNKTINFKNILLENSHNIMRNFVDISFKELDETGKAFNDSIIDALEEEKNTVITTRIDDFSIDELKEIRKDISKTNYHYPDILNMGNLINAHTTPSEIYKDVKLYSEIPFLVPTQKSGIAYLINNKYKEEITFQLEQTVINMMTALPDGLVKLTLIDKTGSGQNFPLLNVFNEKFIEGKVLAEDAEIETELENIKNSMGNISEAISANGFDSIEDYNVNADEIQQRYNFVVVNDFPSGFNKKSSENLLALIESGYKSGIYVFMTSKFETISGYNLPINGIPLGSFLRLMTTFEFSDRTNPYITSNYIKRNIELAKCPIVEEDKFKAFVNSTYKIKFKEESKEQLESKIRYLNEEISKISLKPMILLEKIIPPEEQWYSKTAVRGISVPFGKKGIENTYFSLGIDKNNEIENVHHGLICGMTGSGKTVLIHDIIMMSCIYYSPKELQFYLLDYKEGTEFALYKDFPQINILSMDSEIEFGHDVLQKAIDVISERGKLFKKVDAQNLKGYNERVSEKDRLPRIIIIIDEFQELFPSGDQRISTKTNSLFDNILRRGRSFGVNLILATQTLMDVDLQRSILSNMPLRIGLKMEEKDTKKVFDENNNAPKFLKDPGEGIYNNSHGQSKNNIAFQACNIEDDRLVLLMDRVHEFMKDNIDEDFYQYMLEDRFVYSGEKPGSIDTLPYDDPSQYYVGEPIGLDRNHLSINFNNDFGENMAMVGANQTQAVSTILYIMEQILRKDKTAEIHFSNFSLNLESFFKEETKDYDKNRFTIGKNDNAKEELSAIYEEYKRRVENKIRDAHKLYMVYFLIENSKVLNENRSEERKKIDEMINSASEYGIHIFFYAIDYATVRDQDLMRQLSKFKKKIVFKGGNSEKILGGLVPAKFSKNPQIAMMEKGHSEFKRFKPYIKESVREFYKEDE